MNQKGILPDKEGGAALRQQFLVLIEDLQLHAMLAALEGADLVLTGWQGAAIEDPDAVIAVMQSRLDLALQSDRLIIAIGLLIHR